MDSEPKAAEPAQPLAESTKPAVATAAELGATQSAQPIADMPERMPTEVAEPPPQLPQTEAQEGGVAQTAEAPAGQLAPSQVAEERAESVRSPGPTKPEVTAMEETIVPPAGELALPQPATDPAERPAVPEVAAAAIPPQVSSNPFPSPYHHTHNPRESLCSGRNGGVGDMTVLMLGW